MDPSGSVADTTTYRRQFAYDASGLQLVRTDILLKSPEGEAYRLRREYSYDQAFDKIASSTAWMLIEGDANQSARNETRHRYDDFGRMIATYAPGDAPDAPSTTYEFHLGDPVTQIRARRRTVADQAPNLEEIRCVDGRGREVQTRTRIEGDRYLVSGFAERNSRGAVVRAYQQYEATGAACDTAAPTGVAFRDAVYDAAGRDILRRLPANEDGIRPETRRIYRPLEVVSFDEEDHDPATETPDTLELDGLGRVVASRRTLRGDDNTLSEIRTVLHYDALGRTTGYIDAAGNEKHQEHDLLGRVTRIEDPNTGVTTMAYDAAGRVIQRVNARGETVRMHYDGAGRLLGHDVDGTQGPRLRYDRPAHCDPSECRNAEGRVVELSYPLPDALGEWFGAGAVGRDDRGYDARGRTVLEARSYGDARFVTMHEYDAANRHVATRYPDGRVLKHALDGAGRVRGIDGVIQETTYDDRGLLASTLRADGSRETLRYDVYGRPSQHAVEGTDGVYEAVRYTRDRRGLVREILDDTPESTFPRLDARLRHDAWRRLTSLELGGTGATEALRFTHDDIDNLQTATSSAGSASPAHVGELGYGSGAPGRTTTMGETSMEYDAAGHLTQRGTRALEWDALGRLVAATGDGATTHYAYGPAEECVAVLEPDSLTLHVRADFEIRDGVGRIYARLGNQRVARLDDATQQTYVYPELSDADGRLRAADAFVASRGARSDTAVNATHRAAARRLLHEDAPETTQLFADAVRSLTVATRNGALVGRRTYYPFGQVRAEEGFIDEHGFTGQERDRTTGLDRFQHRWLDTAAGQWASADPAFAAINTASEPLLRQSIGRYRYAGNNPVDFFDPTGLKVEKIASAKVHVNKHTPGTADHKTHVNKQVENVRRALKNSKVKNLTEAQTEALRTFFSSESRQTAFAGGDREIHIGLVSAETLHRRDNNATTDGRWWTYDADAGGISTEQWRNTYAIPPNSSFGENPISYKHSFDVGAEPILVIYGRVSPQTDSTTGTKYEGGGMQVYVLDKVDLGSITSTPVNDG